MQGLMRKVGPNYHTRSVCGEAGFEDYCITLSLMMALSERCPNA
jgi:hypothetical protein